MLKMVTGRKGYYVNETYNLKYAFCYTNILICFINFVLF